MPTVREIYEVLQQIQEDWRGVNEQHKELIKETVQAVTESNLLAGRVEAALAKKEKPEWQKLTFWIQLLPTLVVALALLFLVLGALHNNKCLQYDKLSYNCESKISQ